MQQYKVAYGVQNTNRRDLIDKFIVATLNNDQEILQEILASMMPQPVKPPQKLAAAKNKKEPEPFKHLTKGVKK